MESKKVRDENTRLVEDLIAAVRKKQPVLNNPEELTEDIMIAIREIPQESKSINTDKPVEFRGIIILRRLLAAASVCLFLVFGYEEYVVVDKISRLEKQNTAISESSQYQSALQVKRVISIISADPDMLNRFLDLKTKKINMRTMLRAAMYADMAPEALKILNMTSGRTSNPGYLSIIKQFDSTLNKIKQ
jgi:hypothetical protein